MIKIRKAVVDDASAIATVHVAAWKETYRGIVPDDFLNNLSIPRRTEQWVNSLSDETHAYHRAFVAEVEGQVVGFASYGLPQKKDSGFDGELFAIYILKAEHKQGIGRMLVQAVVNGLREMGSKSMMVWVLKDNPARGFYERLGGEYLYEKPIQIGAEMLMEVAYSWGVWISFQGSIQLGRAGRRGWGCEAQRHDFTYFVFLILSYFIYRRKNAGSYRHYGYGNGEPAWFECARNMVECDRRKVGGGAHHHF